MSIFDWMTTGTQKRSIERFLVKLINHKQLLESKPFADREETRAPAAFEVRVMNWDHRRGDPSTAFFTATRDLTTSGLSFLSHRSFAFGERIAVSIHFESEYHHFLCEVKHCTGLGPREMLVGCSILTRLNPTRELEATTMDEEAASH